MKNLADDNSACEVQIDVYATTIARVDTSRNRLDSLDGC